MRSIRDINWQALLTDHHSPSPQSWESQVFYFVMIDRFSDGKENGYVDNQGGLVANGGTPPYSVEDYENAIKSEEDAARWRAAGNTFVGGTLRGMQSKLGYLKRLGITAIWLSPVLKQAAHDKTAYHGYNTQNFLAVDPHYGSAEDLKMMVRTAHEMGIYVVLDIIFNHAGYVFKYDLPSGDPPEGEPKFSHDGKYPVKGFCNATGEPVLPFANLDLNQYPQAWPDGAVWPAELQSPLTFNCRGCISDWQDPENYLHGDFLYCKDFNLGNLELNYFQPSATLNTLIDVYKYWLAYADLDGYRIDAVKHMPQEAIKLFVSKITQFAAQIGKDNFYLIGEIAGGIPNARQVITQTGLKAFIGIDDLPAALVNMVRGQADPQDYFAFYENEINNRDFDKISHRHMITIYDDHDQIRLGYDKARFPHGSTDNRRLAKNALFVLLTTQGIPCIYYGSEQGFDGAGRDDNYIREAMCGGTFGAFRSKGVHFFNEKHEIYQFASALLKFRHHHPTVVHGQQQLLEISGDGVNFGVPQMLGGQLKGVIPWVRYDDQQLLLCAINTNPHHESEAWIKLGSLWKSPLKSLTYLFSTKQSQLGKSINFDDETEIGTNVLRVCIPAAGCVILGVNKK